MQGVELSVADWTAVLARIRAGDSSAEAELNKVFSRGIQFFILRKFGTEGIEYKARDCFSNCVDAIRKGQLTEPGELMDFARTFFKPGIQREAANSGWGYAYSFRSGRIKHARIYGHRATNLA